MANSVRQRICRFWHSEEGIQAYASDCKTHVRRARRRGRHGHVVLKKRFAGQFLLGIDLEEKKLLLQEKQMNGRQLCWMLRERSKGDRHQEIYKQQEVHRLRLVKDNLPAYHTALDVLLLEVTMPAETMVL